MKKALFIFFTGLISIIILILFAYFRHHDSKLHVVFCDVGQGDAIFIRTPQQAQILIDGGPDRKVLSCLSQNMPFWDRSLDMIIMTHPDADHATGLIDVVKRYHVNNFYTQKVPGDTPIYKILSSALAEKKLSAKYLYTNNSLRENSGFSMITLWPSVEAVELMSHNGAKKSLNELSVIQLLSYGNFQVLLTGDAGSETVERIALQAGDVEVLKVPHHGSATGMSNQFLKQLSAELAVISVGSENSYGHPAKKSLNLLNAHHVKTFRTDQDQEVEIISNGKIWFVEN